MLYLPSKPTARGKAALVRISRLYEKARKLRRKLFEIERNILNARVDLGVAETLAVRAEKAKSLAGRRVKRPSAPASDSPTDDDGTNGQDRESYSDTQDHQTYLVDPDLDDDDGG